MGKMTTKKEWKERLEKRQYTLSERNLFCLYQYVDYSGVTLNFK